MPCSADELQNFIQNFNQTKGSSHSSQEFLKQVILLKDVFATNLVFTGLIQTLGKIGYRTDHELIVFWDTKEQCPLDLDMALGDSIAVDGVCLTVMEILPNGFIAAVSPETVSRTTLSQPNPSPVVNVEASLRVGSKVGGHFVTGHIDGVGYLESSIQTAISWEMSFIVTDSRIARYIVPKGSIAVNGVSLTVADCADTGSWFKVAVIPVTYRETNLKFLCPGSMVNLEGDILGKYVEKFARFSSEDPFRSAPEDREGTSQRDGIFQRGSSVPITPSFLAEHGYG